MKALERVAFLKQFTVLHTSRWGQQGNREGVHICPKICTYYVDVISAVCFILNSMGLNLESFPRCLILSASVQQLQCVSLCLI